MRHPEHALQRACVQYLKTLPPPPKGPWWTAVAPLPGTSARQGALAKGLGLQPGTPDLILVWDGVFVGIELKAAKGQQSSAQKAAKAAIIVAGGFYYLCRNLDDFGFAIADARFRARARTLAA